GRLGLHEHDERPTPLLRRHLTGGEHEGKGDRDDDTVCDEPRELHVDSLSAPLRHGRELPRRMKPKWALIIAVRHTARKVGPGLSRIAGEAGHADARHRRDDRLRALRARAATVSRDGLPHGDQPLLLYTAF